MIFKATLTAHSIPEKSHQLRGILCNDASLRSPESTRAADTATALPLLGVGARVGPDGHRQQLRQPGMCFPADTGQLFSDAKV